MASTPTSKEPWWKIYRQMRSNPREIMSMEMIIRSSFSQVLKEYVQNCSICGISDLVNRQAGWIERFLRTISFYMMFSFVFYFLYTTWVSSVTKPFIVTSETSTYPISQIDFPAVAFCSVNRISKRALKKYAIALHPILAMNNESLEEVEQYILQGGRFLDSSFDEKWETHPFMDVVFKRKFKSNKIIDAMKQLAPSCSEMLVRCGWAGDIVDCDSLFTLRRTARGYCCAFNYVLDYDSATLPNKTIAEIKKQKQPGYLHGLNVVLDPLLEDYAYPINNFRGFDVLLFDPTHFADLSAGRVSHRIAEPDHREFFELTSIKQVAAAEVRKYSSRVRKCLFKDEVPEFNSMYSYSACIVRCRIKTIQSLCKCTPYYLPTGDQVRTCMIGDLMCLNKFKEKFIYMYPSEELSGGSTEGLDIELEDSLYCPHCLPDCELTQHFTKNFKLPMFKLTEKPYYTDRFFENISMTDKVVVSIYHPDGDGVLDKLDVVFYWYEILSNIGGFAGMLIGISVVTVVEIVYYLIIRLMIVLRYNYIKYH